MQFPAFMYHKEHGARLFQTEEELKAAGKGWVDTPARFEQKKAEKAE